MLEGCSQLPLPYKQESALLVVSTNPANAIVYLRARTGEANGPAGAEYWAVGTTPFEGELEPGFWDVKIESTGFQPVEVLVRAVPGQAQSYELQLVSLSGHRWK
jgi:hypothetical protein